jgi:cell division protein FtsZ
VIAIVMFPFRIQDKTLRQADAALEGLLQHADSVIVFDNERFRGIFSGLSVEQGYAKGNEIIADVLRSLIKSVTFPSLINLEPDDFKAIFRNKGLGIVLMGDSRENAKNKNESVVRECWSSPSLDIDYWSATGCLVLITGGNEFGRYDAEEIARSVTDEIDPHADVVWCTDIQKTMDGKIRVYAIMTGIRLKR